MSTTAWKKPTYFSMDEVESIAGEEASITLTYTPATVLPENTPIESNFIDTHEEPVDKLEDYPQPKPYPNLNPHAHNSSNHPLLWTGLISSLTLLLISLFIIDAYQTLTDYYARNPILGHFLSILLLLISSFSLLLIWQTYQNLHSLKTVTYLQKRGKQIIDNNQYGHALPYINQIAQLYKQRVELKTQLDTFYILLNDSHQDREVCQLFSNQVLKELDQQAYQIIAHRATETTLMVMISRIPLIDGILMLWRTLRMIRDIATLYGVKPSIPNTLQLAMGTFQNVLYAGITELIADSTSELLGNSVLSVFSAQLAQGLTSGILTARLGIHTLQACRPLPFTESEQPQLKDIRQEIIRALKKLLNVTKTE